jgi:zinc transporter
VRVWIEHKKIITVHHRRVLSIVDMRNRVAENLGPGTTGELLVMLCSNLVNRMSSVIENIQETVGDFEEQLLVAQSHDLAPR